MPYSYQVQRPGLFTEEGQVRFLAVRDEAKRLLDLAGAVQSSKLMIGSGDSWEMLARIDRLVELGELYEIPNPKSLGWAQHRVFVKGRKST